MARPKEVADTEILAAARSRFLSCGTAIPISAIAAGLGISHATIFNRFGSKEALMIAALGPPRELSCVALLEAGPDKRPMREQLYELAIAVARDFTDLAEGLTLLRGAGVPPERVFGTCDASPPGDAYNAMAGWFGRARDRGLIGPCDIPTLTTAILGALRNRSFAPQVPTASQDQSDEPYIVNLIDLLWHGIAP